MKINFNQLVIILISILFGLSLIIGALLLRYESERYKRQEVEHVQQTLDGLQGSLKSRRYANIHKVSAVKALVAMDPDLTQEDFARAMEVQFRGEHDFLNIGLARDMVIQFMYPIEGNEAAIGLDYRTIPEQFEAVNLARSLNEIVLAGPLPLVQGGEGIIARIPIHVTDTKTEQAQLWGFASVVINNSSLITGAGIEDQEILSIAIRGKDALGEQGEVFYGNPSIFDQEPVTRLIELPYGGWQIAAVPVKGWGTYPILSNPRVLIYLLATLGVLAFIGYIFFLSYKKEHLVNENNILVSSLEVFLKETSDFVYFKDMQSKFIFCSQTLADITGHRHWKDMIGKHDFEVFPADVAKIYNEEEKPVFNEGKALLNKTKN